MKWLLILVIMIHSSITLAESKEEKVRKLFEIQGVEQTWQESIDQSRGEGRKQADQMADQMLNQLTPNKAFREKLDKAIDKFINTLDTKRTAKDIIEVLIPYYAPHFSERELDMLIEFYGSEVARKDTEISRLATKKMSEHFQVENQKIITAATNEFVKDIQKITVECNCQKSK
jgi:hypothetical protein